MAGAMTFNIRMLNDAAAGLAIFALHLLLPSMIGPRFSRGH